VSAGAGYISQTSFKKVPKNPIQKNIRLAFKSPDLTSCDCVLENLETTNITSEGKKNIRNHASKFWNISIRTNIRAIIKAIQENPLENSVLFIFSHLSEKKYAAIAGNNAAMI
jgi:hypothetical protein